MNQWRVTVTSPDHNQTEVTEYEYRLHADAHISEKRAQGWYGGVDFIKDGAVTACPTCERIPCWCAFYEKSRYTPRT